MSAMPQNAADLALSPLGAGDLIDRAVRFYRRNIAALVLIAAPPVVAGTMMSVAWTFLSRQLFGAGDGGQVASAGLYYTFLWLGSIVIWFTQTVAMLTVMGGASRNFVRHLLFGEPITFKDTYNNVRKRLWALLAASGLMTVLLSVLGFGIIYFGLAIGAVLVILAVAALQAIPPLAFVVGLVLGAAVVGGTFWLFFLVASRFAYVPQVMLVEGSGILAAVSRSASLGGGVKRFAALFIFTTVAAYSALAILYVPLAWYAWIQGIELFAFEPDLQPAWYTIASQLTWQASLILLSPVWMIGLCLLYVDQRVRHEGYDIELMAAARLGDIPSVPAAYTNPLQPALGSHKPDAAPAPHTRKTSTLGLDL